MPEKRKLSTRPKRESAKKRTQAAAAGSPAREPSPPDPSPEPLPSKITKETALPTIKSDAFLPDRSLQSIARSGVLAASLERSLQRWLSEGLFEKYWTKPSKKKGFKEDPKNPLRDTMQKLGPCKFVIEPHIFDVTLFAIRQPQATPRPAIPISMANPIMQYTPPTGENSTPQIPQQPQLAQVKQQAKASPVSPRAPVAANPTPSATVSASNNHQNVGFGLGKVSHTAKPTQPMNISNSNSASPLPPKHPSQDPVIQMLAQRASTNPDLKVLMKIVASGTASPEQLKVFQGHIDDLTAILQRETANQKAEPKNLAPAAVTPQAQNIPVNATTSTPVQLAKKGPTLSQAQPSFQASPAPPPSQTKMSTPSISKPEIAGIAIEFNAPGASHDRYLFPRKAILEWLPGGATASFFLVRKPSDSSSRRYLKTKEYFQPVTIRIFSENTKVVDALSRAVAPAEEVRKQMEDIMATKKRADDAHLALRLPIEGDAGETTESSGADTSAKGSGGKRNSILKSAVTASSHKNTVGSNRREKSTAWLDTRCQFCLVMVPAPAPTLDESPICKPCWDLRMQDMRKNPLIYPTKQNSGDFRLPQAAGPQYLIL